MKRTDAFLLSGLLFFSMATSAFEPLFNTRIDYPTARSFKKICSADFDGDGLTDIAGAFSLSDTGKVAVFINDPDGVFHEGGEYITGSAPQFLLAADLNGDGDNDLAVVNHGITYGQESTISILLNKGDGTFADAINYIAGKNPLAICKSDLDGDSDYDLIVTNPDFDSVSVLINYGDGTYAYDSNYAVGFNPRSVCAADFDGDGTSDIAVANCDTSNVSILLNDGYGKFLSAVNYEVGATPIAVCAEDFNGDGANDLAVGKYYSDRIAILENNGNGTFAPPVEYIAGGTFTSIISSDFDNDGDYDLAATQDGPEAVAVLLNNGNGIFESITSYTVGGEASSVCAADFNDDGLIDIITGQSAHYISLLKNIGGGVFQQPPNYDYDVGHLIATDCDNDGDYDLAGTGADYVSIMKNNGDGTYALPIETPVDSVPVCLVASDLNGDGIDDLALAHYIEWPDTGFISILLGNGDGTYQAPLIHFTGSTPRSVLAADFDNDGDNDLAADGGGLYILLNDGNGAFQNPVNYGVGITAAIISADMNGDGSIDIVGNAADAVLVFLNNGAGSFDSPIEYSVGPGPEHLSISDIDSDGDNDIAVTYNITDGVTVLANKGDGTLETMGYYFDTVDKISAIGLIDIDSDGDNDMTILNQWGNNVGILLNDGYGTFHESVAYGVERWPKSMHIADYDGDGDNDIAVSGDSSLLILLNRIIITDVENEFMEQPLPRELSLFQNYPNPFNPLTRIDYTIQRRNQVTITIYNLLGQEVATIVDDVKPAGRHSITWDGRDYQGNRVASGVYFYRLRVGDITESKKMVLLK